MISTENFNPESDPKLLCTCGHPYCDKRSVNQAHLDRVQLVRDDEGSMVVTSGGRCPYHPNEVHRTTPADHQLGNGLDVACNGSNRGNIVNSGIANGCNAIGIAKDFVHLGYRPDLPEGHITMWVY